MKLQPGTLLQGDRYRIIDVLGQGGFGITYLAEQVMAERKVCIKEFFPKEYYNRNEDSRSISLGSQGSAEIMELYKAKFIKEAKTIAKLDHPNIIHIFDVFAENNTAYYVMEYIDGESLSALVKSRGVLPESEAIGYIKQVAAALGSIHEQRIMHLDIKPANVMLRKEDGRVVLIDFGLSKQYDAEGNQTSSTPVGISAGYAPMEQYQQGGVREFSPETDIYSLGATLYYLVTGVVPPQAATIVDEGLPELPAHLSANVRNAIERSMEVQRKRRPHSIKEFLALLEDNNPIVVPIPTPAPVSEETAFGAPASNAADDRTVVSTPAPKAQPTPQPKKEWTPKYSAEMPKNAEETKKKSKWWMYLLGILLIGGGAYFLLIANQSHSDKKTLAKAYIAKTGATPVRYGYDDDLGPLYGDVKSIIFTAHESDGDEQSYAEFNEHGDVVLATRGEYTATYDYKYDSSGKMLCAKQYTNGVLREQEEFKYGPHGKIVSIVNKRWDPNGVLYNYDDEVYSYDSDNKLVSINKYDGYIKPINAYDEFDEAKGIDYSSPVMTHTYVYDANGVLTSSTKDFGYNSMKYYTYDKNGNIIKEKDEYSTNEYKYNANNQIVRNNYYDDYFQANSVSEYKYNNKGLLISAYSEISQEEDGNLQKDVNEMKVTYNDRGSIIKVEFITNGNVRKWYEYDITYR